MPQKETDTTIPKIKSVKEDKLFVVKDEKGFFYDRGVVFKNMKEAEAAADDWKEYYARPMGQ